MINQLPACRSQALFLSINIIFMAISSIATRCHCLMGQVHKKTQIQYIQVSKLWNKEDLPYQFLPCPFCRSCLRSPSTTDNIIRIRLVCMSPSYTMKLVGKNHMERISYDAYMKSHADYLGSMLKKILFFYILIFFSICCKQNSFFTRFHIYFQQL